MPFRRLVLLSAAAAALRPPLSSRRASVKRYESLLDVAVDATPAAQLAAWLEGWRCASDPQFPVETTIQDGALRLRYAAMPSHGVDVVARAPGADSPSTRIAVERVGGPAPSTINSLLRSAEDRILDGLRRDLERDFGASLLRPPPKPQPRQKQQMPDTLYDGSYGDAFEQDVIDLIEPSTEEDESIRSMFAEGEKLARRAAGLDENDALDVVESTGEAQFEVRLDPELKGGIDLFAPPPQVSGVQAPAIDFSSVDVSPEIAARFGVLLRELRLAEDPQLILDAYRDVLLDDAFPLLARKAVTDDIENAEAVDLLNKEALNLATQLAEIAAAAEKQHLETIRLLCEAARDRGDAGLRQAAQTHRARLDDDFVAYLKHSVAVEASSLRQRKISERKDAIASKCTLGEQLPEVLWREIFDYASLLDLDRCASASRSLQSSSIDPSLIGRSSIDVDLHLDGRVLPACAAARCPHLKHLRGATGAATVRAAAGALDDLE